MARRKDGTVFPIDRSVSSFTVDGMRHFAGIVRDITRVKQAEENRQRLLERLTESNTELERFAYVASHDMQEPLRMVLNFRQIVATDYADKLDDDGKEYLRIVGDSALRMRDMVQDLLDYARLGQEARTFVAVDMEAISVANWRDTEPISCSALPAESEILAPSTTPWVLRSLATAVSWVSA